MAFCSFSKNAAMFDATPIENIFLMEYMPIAPDEFLRVYLYGRMLCLHPELGGDLADTAKALRMDEDTVFNAFAYWERQGLVERLTDRPPTYAFLPVKYDTACSVNEMDRDYYEYRDFNSSLQDFFSGKYLLSAGQYRVAHDWVELMGFTKDAALRIVEYELQMPGGKAPASVFKRADKRAIEWSERGIRSLEDVENAISFDGRAYELGMKVMKQFSFGRKPTVAELKLVRDWIEWGLSDEQVVAACDKTNAANSPSFKYLNTILEKQYRQADAHFDDVKALLHELGAGHSMPAPGQIEDYKAFLKKGFEKETILLAAAQCAKLGRNNFEELGRKLERWAEKGLITAEQVRRHLADVEMLSSKVAALLEKAGSAETATGGDVNMYVRWKENHSDALIAYAAECAYGAKYPMSFMNKLLSDWQKAGVTTPQQASNRGQKAELPQQMNYQQHSYTEEEYNDFFNDPLKDFGEGSDK